MSKANDLKARIQGKNAAQAYLDTGLTPPKETTHSDKIIDNDKIIDVPIDVDKSQDQIDLGALKKKVDQDMSLKTKSRFEDEHRKLTVWVHNDAFEALQLLAGDKRGQKTKIVTEALLKYASEYMKK